jgi:broad specificity phosphatase PhoE
VLKRIFIFRHGETDWNAEGRFQGHTDVPLNDKGRAQATALIPILREKKVEAILSSDLSRARETAQIIGAALSVPLFEDIGLREAFLGDAQGLTWEEIQNSFGVEVATRWGSSHPTDADVAYPGGESGAQVVERVFEAMERFLRSESFVTMGVSSHGGVIRRVLHTLLPPGFPKVRIPNTVLYELSFDTMSGKWSQHSFEVGPLS